MFENIFALNKVGVICSTNIKKYPEEYEILCKFTNYLPKDCSLVRRKWHIDKNINEIPKCMFCDNSCCWRKEKRIYSKYCSVKCANKDEVVLSKRKNTNIEKYGVAWNVQRDDFAQKTAITMFEKYGVSHAMHSNELKEKLKQNNIKKYGVECVLTLENIKDKIKKTNLERYGVENCRTNNNISEKIEKTNLERYGTTCVLESDKIKDKIKKTNLERYGNYSFTQSQVAQSTLDLLNDKEWLIKQHKELKFSLTEIAIALDVSVSMVSVYCKKHDINVIRYDQSMAEKEITEFICNYYKTECKRKDLISPYEIDIFIPSINLAVEYNGIIWHSENFAGKNRQYHLEKYKLCKAKNIKLIQIFSNEWHYNKEIVKSRLLQSLGKTEKIYARNCLIKKIPSLDSNNFINSNHIQGHVNAPINYGLFYKGELVAVMTFSKSRYEKNANELLRFCNKLGKRVVGGASKLFTRFIKDYSPEKIVSYSDKRWGNGNLYEKLGFVFSHESPPNYFYFKINDNTEKLYSRLQFQKHKLKDKLENFDASLSEWQNMQNNGYDRIWDCGNSVWMWKK